MRTLTFSILVTLSMGVSESWSESPRDEFSALKQGQTVAHGSGRVGKVLTVLPDERVIVQFDNGRTWTLNQAELGTETTVVYGESDGNKVAIRRGTLVSSDEFQSGVVESVFSNGIVIVVSWASANERQAVFIESLVLRDSCADTLKSNARYRRDN